MKKAAFLIAALSLSLAGCGGSDGGGINDSGSSAPEIKTITLNAIGSTSEVSDSELINLEITSMNQTVTVKSGTDISNFLVKGINNLVTFEPNVSVKTCELRGSDNTINLPADMAISCDDSGLGNQILRH